MSDEARTPIDARLEKIDERLSSLEQKAQEQNGLISEMIDIIGDIQGHLKSTMQLVITNNKTLNHIRDKQMPRLDDRLIGLDRRMKSELDKGQEKLAQLYTMIKELRDKQAQSP